MHASVDKEDRPCLWSPAVIPVPGIWSGLNQHRESESGAPSRPQGSSDFCTPQAVTRAQGHTRPRPLPCPRPGASENRVELQEARTPSFRPLGGAASRDGARQLAFPGAGAGAGLVMAEVIGPRAVLAPVPGGGDCHSG